MSNVNCQMSIVKCQLSNVNCQMLIVNCQFSNVNCQMSIVKCQLLTVHCQLLIALSCEGNLWTCLVWICGACFRSAADEVGIVDLDDGVA